MNAIDVQRGLDDLSDALEDAQAIGSTEEWIHELSWHAFLVLIQRRLDEVYPEDIFGAASDVEPVWLRADGKSLDPGIRWCILLRRALAELES